LINLIKKRGKREAQFYNKIDYNIKFWRTMRNRNLLIIYFSIFFGCHNVDIKTPISKSSDSGNLGKIGKNETSLKNDNSGNIIPDFLKISKEGEINFGFLQGVEQNDSSGPYFIKEFITDSLSFRLIFYSKNGNKSTVTFADLREGEANDYKYFICFAFVFPMLDPYKMKNYHDDNTKYPVTVKSYMKKGRNWQFVSNLKVSSISDLSQYEINTIYMNLLK
jgi:hypothetical protein